MSKETTLGYNPDIEYRIENAVLSNYDLTKKKMFGGLCYLLNKNMCFGVYKDYLIVRVGDKEKAESYLKDDLILPFDLTGKKMKGWIMVSIELLNTEDEVLKWSKIGIDFAQTLPSK